MLLSKNRKYDRGEPTRDDTLIIIFCEGIVTEPQYFKFFNNIKSNIALEIIAPASVDNNSPAGLYASAVNKLILSDDNPLPKYNLRDEDEVWFVIDTDKWEKHIDTIYEECGKHNNWFIAQSNPCFELWQYYHFFEQVPTDQGLENSVNWKSYLNSSIKGGFNKKIHPMLVKTAIDNSKAIHSEENNRPAIYCTSVFKLVERFYPLIATELEEFLNTVKSE